MTQPHVCSIIPGYYLKRIIDSGTATAEEIDCFQAIIDQSRALRRARVEHCQNLYATQPDAVSQAVAGGGQLNRSVYNVHNTESLSTNDLDIREGGPAVSLVEDPSDNGNECYVGLQKTYEFLLKFFNRNSLNGKGFPLQAFIHYGINWGNAMWDGKNLVFGDGNASFNGFTHELDIIAHEMGHGIVQFTINLDYEYQIGALNESIADVFGIMVKQWSEKEDSHAGTPREPSWLIGEGLWRAHLNRAALRNMKDPGKAFAQDNQPAHWDEYVDHPKTEEGDWGGVHVNSGIPNRAFYLAATKIGGNSWEGAGQVWYKAVTDRQLYRKPRTGFKAFADATIRNAGEHLDEVRAAWEEVGYPFPGRDWELIQSDGRKL